MQPQTKQCQNCKNDFTIESDDFAFYEKIKVPPPTFCPECRMQRRYSWRNERTLYKRKCDLCMTDMITVYSPDKPYKVYCSECWWGDGWSPENYRMDFDFSRSFFDQFQELMLNTPRVGLMAKNCINSKYVNHSASSQNCYMSFVAWESEDLIYSTSIINGKGCVDCYRTEQLPNENLYECIFCSQLYDSQYCYNVHNSFNCLYSFDLKNCNDCFLSYNLRGKSYCFMNKQLTKEEYKNKIKEFDLGSYKVRKDLYIKWIDIIKNKSIHKFSIIERSTNCTGNIIFHSKNCKDCFECSKTEDSKYITTGVSLKDSMDSYHVGTGATELIYETHALTGTNCMFSHLCYDSSFVSYCDTCHNSNYLFGCVSVKKGEYMIFNKKYSKEKFIEMKDKIIEHMKKTGEYGEFFPSNISPFAYNETQGSLYMPITKAEALSKGFGWQDNLPTTFGLETINTDDIPDNISDIKEEFTEEILKCSESGKNYRIIRDEIIFYKKNNIPIPRIHPDERYKYRINIKPLRKNYHRSCMCGSDGSPQATSDHGHEGKCPNEFETSYAPDRPEIVYCESCYQKEVI
ncbi:MAG: hypothetical protein R3B64_02400 [Candidatus Paceibacterota bacterium]